jgi:hypothetical protein
LIILPLIETLAVNGHFLSTYLSFLASLGVLNPNPTFLKYLLAFCVLSLRSFLVLRNTALYF